MRGGFPVNPSNEDDIHASIAEIQQLFGLGSVLDSVLFGGTQSADARSQPPGPSPWHGAPDSAFGTSTSTTMRRTMRGDGVTEIVTTTTTRSSDGQTRTITRRQTSDGAVDETVEQIS